MHVLIYICVYMSVLFSKSVYSNTYIFIDTVYS